MGKCKDSVWVISAWWSCKVSDLRGTLDFATQTKTNLELQDGQSESDASFTGDAAADPSSQPADLGERIGPGKDNGLGSSGASKMEGSVLSHEGNEGEVCERGLTGEADASDSDQGNGECDSTSQYCMQMYLFLKVQICIDPLLYLQRELVEVWVPFQHTG